MKTLLFFIVMCAAVLIVNGHNRGKGQRKITNEVMTKKKCEWLSNKLCKNDNKEKQENADGVEEGRFRRALRRGKGKGRKAGKHNKSNRRNKSNNKNNKFNRRNKAAKKFISDKKLCGWQQIDDETDTKYKYKTYTVCEYWNACASDEKIVKVHGGECGNCTESNVCPMKSQRSGTKELKKICTTGNINMTYCQLSEKRCIALKNQEDTIPEQIDGKNCRSSEEEGNGEETDKESTDKEKETKVTENEGETDTNKQPPQPSVENGGGDP